MGTIIPPLGGTARQSCSRRITRRMASLFFLAKQIFVLHEICPNLA